MNKSLNSAKVLPAQPLRRQHMQRAKGFTLIEIMIVVVIIGVLGATILPNIMSSPDKARVQAALTDLRSISSALDLYRLDNFSYPSTDQGLDALVTPPSGFPEAKHWNPEGYLPKSPEDPWGNAYVYANNGRGFELTSYGRDGQQGGEEFDADLTLDDL